MALHWHGAQTENIFKLVLSPWFWNHCEPSFQALLWWHLRMSVRPCVRVSSVRSVHSVRGSPVQLGTLDTAHLSPGRPAPSTVKLQRFLSLFVKLSLSSSSAVLSHNTQPSALSVCPVVSHQFPHYSATYGWYQICISAILRDFPISMFPTFQQLRHADSIFSSDGDWETESREYKLHQLRLRLLQRIQTLTVIPNVQIHIDGLIISSCMHDNHWFWWVVSQCPHCFKLALDTNN